MDSTYLLAAVSTLLVLSYTLRRRGPKSLPPGPKGSFLIGNLSIFQLEGEEKAKASLRWLQDYGSIMHFQVFGKHMIVLNTAQAAADLMDKRAAVYSHRPRMPMFIELVGNGWLMSVASGELHKELRAIAQRYFSAQVKDWQLIQMDSVRTLLRNLSANPNDWSALIRLNSASTILRTCYGYEVTSPDDSLLKIVQEAVESPRNGPYLVDIFPFLKYYPSWLPGGQFHKDAADARDVSQQIRHVPFNNVRKEMEAGTAAPSFISTLLTQLPPEEDLEKSHQAGLIRDSAANMYGAAMDSTVSFMFTFFGIMAQYPEVQRRAQAELDKVLDKDRLPTLDDRSMLPYIDGIVLEVFRWNVVTPLGFPHMVTQDDEYLGYHIPKGTTVFGNMWAILRDPVVFPNPNTFDPSRFLADTEGSANARKVIDSTVFGWGRRTCPGRHFGYSGLLITMSHILACFEICRPVDEAGKEFVPVIEYDDKSIVRRALPPNCTIKVRRPERLASLELSGTKYA